MRAAPVFLRLNCLSTTNRMALMAAPNNLRSRIPMNLRGRMSVSYSKIHESPAAAVRHVLLLPGLGITGQEDAGRAVSEEDGHRVVVGLGEEFAWWRGDEVGSRPSALK
jgi:hypothetical protein